MIHINAVVFLLETLFFETNIPFSCQYTVPFKMADQRKGKVELSTFLSWGKQSVIGYKTKDENSKTYVVFIWCKCCVRNKDAILSNLKGSVCTSALAFIEGTNVVTKYQVSFLFFHC